jgi:hypothetical protein
MCELLSDFNSHLSTWQTAVDGARAAAEQYSLNKAEKETLQKQYDQLMAEGADPNKLAAMLERIEGLQAGMEAQKALYDAALIVANDASIAMTVIQGQLRTLAASYVIQTGADCPISIPEVPVLPTDLPSI